MDAFLLIFPRFSDQAKRFTSGIGVLFSCVTEATAQPARLCSMTLYEQR